MTPRSRLVGIVMVLASASAVGAQPLSDAAPLRVVPYLTGLEGPVDPVDPRLQYVLEKAGRIRVVESGVLRPTAFLDITGEASALDVREHTAELAPLQGSLVSIDADAQGEVFLVMLSGSILRLTTTDDADGNGLPDAWEVKFGLPALGPRAGGPFGDPDADGLINAEELRQGLHPTGARTRHRLALR